MALLCTVHTFEWLLRILNSTFISEIYLLEICQGKKKRVGPDINDIKTFAIGTKLL